MVRDSAVWAASAEIGKANENVANKEALAIDIENKDKKEVNKEENGKPPAYLYNECTTTAQDGQADRLKMFLFASKIVGCIICTEHKSCV